MTPANIVGMAMIKGLDVIAVTDHNTCKNVPAVIDAANKYGVLAIPGMELSTMEDIHVLCLFRTVEDSLKFDEYVHDNLLCVTNDEKIFGKQLIYDNNDNVIGKENLSLIYASKISFEDVYDIVKEYNGVIIPAHIDKTSTSLLASYGFVPEDSKFTCVEVKNMANLHELRRNNPYLNKCKIITDSDAHYLEHINEPINKIYVKKKSIDAILNSFDE